MLVGAGLSAIALGTVVGLAGGVPGIPFLALSVALLVLWSLAKFGSIDLWVPLALFAFLALDPVGSRTYYGALPWVDTLSKFGFESLAKLVSVPLGVNGFELLLGTFFLAQFFFGEKLPPHLRPHLWVTGLLVAMALAHGLAGGGVFALAFRQLRPCLLAGLAIVIGARIPWTRRLVYRLFAALWLVAVVKSLLGLYVLIFKWDWSLGEREYLIDHISSDILVSGLIAGWLYTRQMAKGALARRTFFLTLPLILFVWQINDRRTSAVGLVVSLLVLAALNAPHLWTYRRRGIALVAGFSVFLAATWRMSGPLGFAARTIQSLAGGDGSLSYRTLENFNLAAALTSQPLLGFGFGRRFPMVAPLPDISFLFSDFDLIPHNNLLALWAAGGPLLLAAMVWFFLDSALRSAVLLVKGSEPWIRGVGVLGLTAMIRWWTYGAFDMGFVESRMMVTGGLFMGMVWAVSQKSIRAQSAYSEGSEQWRS